MYGTPERNLAFDVNDFDETLPGPWEWDVKRLAVSVLLAARNLQIEDQQAATVAGRAVRAYRDRMAELGTMAPLDAGTTAWTSPRCWTSRGRSGPRT